MLYSISKITSDVRTALHLGRAHQSLIAEGDDCALFIDQIIQTSVVKAVAKVHTEAPAYLLTPSTFGGAITWHDTTSGACSGSISLPADFMRLVSLRMSDWQKPCCETLNADSLPYAMQQSRWHGLRGSYERPKCLLSAHAAGLTLDFFSCRSTSATIAEALYMPYPSITPTGSIEVSPRCYPQLIDLLASQVDN